MDTLGACLILCEHRNCRGKCKRVRGRIEDFSTIYLNDQVSSITGCDSSSSSTETQNTSAILPRQRRIKKKKDSKNKDKDHHPPSKKFK